MTQNSESRPGGHPDRLSEYARAAGVPENNVLLSSQQGGDYSTGASFGRHFRKLLDRGFHVVPIAPREKRPSRFDGNAWWPMEAWNVYASESPAEAALARWEAWPGVGVGIPTGELAAIDIDCLDEPTARLAEELAVEHFKVTPARRIGLAPKRLLVYRAERPMRKLRSAEFDVGGLKCAVEVLGLGQQFVAYGVHPATGRPYAWTGAGLSDLTPADLPVVDLDKMMAFLADFEQALEMLGHERKTNGTSAGDHVSADPADEHGLVPSAMQALPNGDVHYDEWIRIGIALKRSLPADPGLAFRLFDEWSAKSSKYHPGATEAAWDSFAIDDRPVTVGAGTILHLALDSGWERPREAADDSFPPIEDDDPLIRSPEPAAPIVFTRPSDLAGRDPPPREWLVDGWIPRRKTTILVGDGGVGKTLLAQQLGTAVDCGKDFLGRPVRRGPVLALFSEDDTDELHRRQRDICTSMGLSLSDLANSRWWTADDLKDGAHLMVMTPDHPGGRPTILFNRLMQAIKQIRPELVILDHAANVYAGPANSGPEVTAFVNRVPNRLCTEFGTTVVLLQHPSLRGINDASGEGGSRAWNNSVRSRLYLTRPKDDHGSNRRVLRTMKANYGPIGEETHLEWRRGAFHVSTPDGYEGTDVPGELRGQILNAIQAAWEAGDPWSHSGQAGRTGRAAKSKIHQQFGIPIPVAVRLLDSWIDAGVVLSDTFDKRNKRTGLQVVPLPR